jgi:hypothetical protein
MVLIPILERKMTACRSLMISGLIWMQRKVLNEFWVQCFLVEEHPSSSQFAGTQAMRGFSSCPNNETDRS